jgi:hypothetical protein
VSVGGKPGPRLLGRHSGSNRELYLISLESFEDQLWSFSGGGRFTSFCAMHAREISSPAIATFCSHLLQLGCAYLCTWGPDCERVHDIMDQEVVYGHQWDQSMGCVMTTWHADDTLQSALDFFLDCTEPDEAYAPTGCDRGLIVCVGRPN